MLVDNPESIWLLLLGCTYTLAMAAIVIAALFRHTIARYAVTYSAVTAFAITRDYELYTSGNLTPELLSTPGFLDAWLLIIFIVFVVALLKSSYSLKHIYRFLIISVLAATLPLLFADSNKITSLYLSGLVLIIACLCFSLHAYTQRLYGAPLVFLSASKLIVVSITAWLCIYASDLDSLTGEYSLLIAALYLLDMSILISVCWRTLQRAAVRRAQQRLSAARQETKIASLAPLFSASRHNLRAPLADIIGLAELVNSGPLNQDQKKSLLDLKHSAQKGLEEINRLFTFSSDKTEGATNTLFSLTTLITDCAQYYSTFLDKNNKELIIKLPDTSKYNLYGLQHKISQSLIHILEHVLANIDANEVLITADIEVSNLVIKIQATDKNIQEYNSFDSAAFESANTLIYELNGSLKSNNTEGTIQIKIPVEIQHFDTHSPSLITQLTGKKVLVLDDNITSCNVIAAYLERFNLSGSICTNSTEATAILHHAQNINDAIALVIVDYLMPDIDGISFIKQILSDNKIVEKPEFIVMSNTNQIADSRTLQALDIDLILEKPVMPDTLRLALIQKLINSRLQRNISVQPISALVVEDNPPSAKVCKAILEKNHIQCALASSGNEALRLIQETHYDLIFIDLYLEDIEGIALYEQIKKSLPDSENIPLFIALTADDSASSEANALAAGMDIFISKPLTPARLQSVLGRLEEKNLP